MREIPAVELRRSFLNKMLHVHIEYPICPNNSSYSLQNNFLLFCSSIVYISKMCILLVLVFCFCEMPAIEHEHFFSFYCTHGALFVQITSPVVFKILSDCQFNCKDMHDRDKKHTFSFL